ncbi:MAG TPA: hypothetical protein VGR12_00730 [Solirubrobacteraceae bacterium]|nr:hypothetical protein [Solirubrobacteraceae bacterium]
MRRLLVLLAALPLLAGCGGDGGGESSSDLGGERMRMEGEGVSAADQSRGRFELDMAIGEQEPKPVEMITADGQMYMRGAMFDGLIPPGKEWFRVPDDSPSTMTPAEFVDFLRGTGDVEEVGTEQVRGRKAIHLRGPLDMKELLERTDSPAARQFSQMPQAEELEATIDVWIDEADERVSRMRLEMTHPDTTGSMELSADILEYDVPLEGIDAPPAAKVADGSELGG